MAAPADRQRQFDFGSEHDPLLLTRRTGGMLCPGRLTRRQRRRRVRRLLLAERKAAEALVEARDLAARIEQTLVAAGPRRVRGGIDVERQRVTFAAPGGARLEHGAVGHLHLDHVVIGVGVLLHVTNSLSRWFPTSRER